MGEAKTRWLELGLLAAASLFACAPALGGSWVYDDWVTATHPAQDDLGDLARVFARDSSAYMVASQNLTPLGVTYRPLSMASLIALQSVAPNAPWAQHLLSWLLHFGCAIGLYAACERVSGRRAPRLSLLLAAFFALHPIAIEAYAWINGRSDVLAGVFVALLAWSLPFGAEAAGARRCLVSALCAAGAALSKETGVVMAAALTAASLMPARGLPDRAHLRRSGPAVCAAAVGIASALAARVWVTRAQVSGAGALFSDLRWLSALASTLALALEHLVLPLPRAMLCLGFELGEPPAPAAWLALTASLGLLTALALRQSLRSLALVLGMLVSLITVLPVRQLVWLGFDRYLYLPLLVACFAAALSLGVPARAPSAPLASLRAPFVRGWGARALYALYALLALSSFFSARAYASQEAWLRSLIVSRPDDPSGYIKAAEWYAHQGDTARAVGAALSAPRSARSPALAHELFALLFRLGRTREAIELADAALRRYPDHAAILFDTMLARAAQGRFDLVYGLAARLADDRMLCQPTRAWLTGWLGQPALPAGERGRVADVVASMRCGDPAGS